MLCERFAELPRIKLVVDFDDVWSDIVTHYKKKHLIFESQIRVVLRGCNTIDTGGVRCQVYTAAYKAFATNKYIRLFEGPERFLRPACSAEARSSGLLKVLGGMISHSICQDTLGFPYLSPTCFWYLVGGENKALQYASIEDLPADSRLVLTQVCSSTMFKFIFLKFLVWDLFYVLDTKCKGFRRNPWSCIIRCYHASVSTLWYYADSKGNSMLISAALAITFNQVHLLCIYTDTVH